MFDGQDELLRRIHTDVMDGCEEELEMEMEDRVDEPQHAGALKRHKAERQRYFRELFRLQARWCCSTAAPPRRAAGAARGAAHL